MREPFTANQEEQPGQFPPSQRSHSLDPKFQYWIVDISWTPSILLTPLEDIVHSFFPLVDSELLWPLKLSLNLRAYQKQQTKFPSPPCLCPCRQIPFTRSGQVPEQQGSDDKRGWEVWAPHICQVEVLIISRNILHHLRQSHPWASNLLLVTPVHFCACVVNLLSKTSQKLGCIPESFAFTRRALMLRTAGYFVQISN